MTAESLLRTLAVALRAAGGPFMLTGSTAAAYYGAGRATIDIDLVIDPQADQLDAFVHSMVERDLYVSDIAARASSPGDTRSTSWECSWTLRVSKTWFCRSSNGQKSEIPRASSKTSVA